MTTLKQRRNFLKQAALLGGGVALVQSPFSAASSLTDSNPNNGYKALVCLDLDGGNDGTNMIVPNTTSEYERYAALRGELAIEQNTLLPINPGNQTGTYGLHPALPTLQSLFNQGNAAILANVGTMVSASGTLGTPPKKGSHSNQRQLWQGLDPAYMATRKQGWLGLVADLDPQIKQGSLSLAGKSLWQTGIESSPFIMGENGPISFLASEDTQLTDLMNELAGDAQSHSHHFISALADSDQQARDRADTMADTLNTDEIDGLIAGFGFPATSLGRSFATTLRAILTRDTLAMQRQSFHIRRGGFDFHANHLDRQAALLAEVDAAVSAFQSALEQLGLTDSVTTFTLSDFGRTTTNNGSGTAHGWGNHHFIIGGAVQGGQIYGRMPSIDLNDPGLDPNKGILIPDTAIEQYGATLALWFGLPEALLPHAFPHIGLFNQANLGFMLS